MFGSLDMVKSLEKGEGWKKWLITVELQWLEQSDCWFTMAVSD